MQDLGCRFPRQAGCPHAKVEQDVRANAVFRVSRNRRHCLHKGQGLCRLNGIREEHWPHPAAVLLLQHTHGALRSRLGIGDELAGNLYPCASEGAPDAGHQGLGARQMGRQHIEILVRGQELGGRFAASQHRQISKETLASAASLALSIALVPAEAVGILLLWTKQAAVHGKSF